MNLKLNNNGNSAEDLRNQFMELHRLSMALRDHLARMDFNHGRNYQTLPNPSEAQTADREVWREHLRAAGEIMNYAMDGAVHIIRQREDL